MARKKKTYRQLMHEFYEFAISSTKRAFDKWGIDVTIPSPKYKESRSRNYTAYIKKVSRKLDELDERIEVRRKIEEEQRYKDYLEEHGAWDAEDPSEYQDYDPDDYTFFEERDESERQDLLTTAFDASRNQTDTGEYEYTSFEESLYENYMSRLYYYQFVPSVKALINTIEGDEEHFKNIIIRELSAMRDKGAGGDSGGGLPSIEGKGNYEYGDQIASYIQEFLNSTTGEQYYDEGYDSGDYY